MKLPLRTRIARAVVLCLLPVFLILVGMCLAPRFLWYPFMWGFLPEDMFLAGGILAMVLSFTWLLYTKAQAICPEEGGQPPARRDRLPVETFLLLCGALVWLAFEACFWLTWIVDFDYPVMGGFNYVVTGDFNFTSTLLFGAIFGLVALLVSYQALSGLVVRAKWGTLFTGSLTYRFGCWLWPHLRDGVWPACKKAYVKARHMLQAMGRWLQRMWVLAREKAGPRLRRLLELLAREYKILLACALGVFVYALFCNILLYNYWWGMSDLPLAGFVLLQLLLFGVVATVCVQLRGLFEASRHIAEGDLAYTTGTENLLPQLKAHGENLNSIGSGMAVAVEERMKSERLKTDLITNVSHDIKTPLTSIVSYVDLLQKEPCDNERIQEYLAVLERQAGRLKKLTEDLVEASKAATGSLPVTLQPTGVLEILNQALGEYSDRLAARGLQTVTTLPQDEVLVLADGRHLWRVFDNLLCNICKYAHEGTRVYIEVSEDPEGVYITMKNMSAYPLNISADDLMERFVRGDTSRTTEGSGLGLSIAQSLLDLQNGKFSLSIDGDLFKTTIALPGVKDV